MSDDYAWWTNALQGKRGPVYESDPMPGYYRNKRRDGTFEPVAFWKDSVTGEMRCHINGRQPDDLRALELWVYVNKNPVTEEAYWHRMDTGEWPDVDGAASQAAKGPALDPQEDPVASLKAEIEAAAAGLDAYKTITSDEASARAQTLRSTLQGLSNKADKAREAEKAPHLAAGRAVDEKWQPLVKDAKAKADKIRAAMEAWENEKRRLAREEEARAAEAAKAADPLVDVLSADASNAPPQIETRQPPPAPSTQIRGGSGRAASVGTKRVLKSIDLQKCWDKMGGLPEVYNLFMELAERQIAAGKHSAEDLGAVFEETASIR